MVTRVVLLAMFLAACEGGASGPERVHGFVEKGSISHAVMADQSLRAFALELDGKRTWVVLRGPAPDVLKDGAEIRATGKLVAPASLTEELAALGLSLDDEPKILDATSAEAGCNLLMFPETADRAPKWCRR